MDKSEKVFNLAVRRGFFWPAYEIYGGVSGLYTWGPLGVILKNKIIDLWRSFFVDRFGFLEIQGPSIAPYIVFEASGHVEGFKDIMVSCTKCGSKYRADTLLSEMGIEVSEASSLEEIKGIIEDNGVKCPSCGGSFSDPTYFITMFKTTIGPYSDSIGFLRPETAQNMFVEFKRIYEAFRRTFPIGIAQIGRGYRNEISPRQGPIRLREFDMMELEFFFDPLDPKCPHIDEVEDEEINILYEDLIRRGGKEYETMSLRDALDRDIIRNEYLGYFMVLATQFLETLGIPRDKQRFREKLEGERAHYAIQTFDQEVKLSRWGWVEVSGHANRTDYDLSRHIKWSRSDLYAYRRLPRPKTIEEIDVRPKARRIREVYGDEVGRIMRDLNRLGSEEIYRRLRIDGYINVSGIRLDESFFEIRVEKRLVDVEPFIPHVIEPSFGLDRIAYSVLEYAYREREGRVILSLPAYLAPYDLAIYPLTNDEELVKYSEKLCREVSSYGYRVHYDSADSIGRRYARGDEIGIPVALTIDYRSIEDDTVTIRDRDTWKQYRIRRGEIKNFIDRLLAGESFDSIAGDMGLELYYSGV